MFENFCLIERIKQNIRNENDVNMYFLRTHDQKEIDYIEEGGGALKAFEFKWKTKKVKVPQLFYWI